MGAVRYIAQGITEAQPEGLHRYRSGTYAEAYSFVKAEETAYDPKTKQSTLRFSVWTKTNVIWYSADYLDLGGFGLRVNGNPVVMHPLAKGDGLSQVYTEIAWGEVTLPPRKAKDKSCVLTVFAPVESKSYEGSAAWDARQGAMPCAKLGDYEFPLTAVKDGSVVYIGGEAYGVYIGNGSALERVNVLIGGEKY